MLTGLWEALLYKLVALGKSRIRQHALQPCLPLAVFSWPHPLYYKRLYSGDSSRLQELWLCWGESWRRVFMDKCRRSEMTEMTHYTGMNWLNWSTRVYWILYNQSMPSLFTGVNCLGSWLLYRMFSVLVIQVVTVTTGVYLMVLDTFHLTFMKLMTLHKGISFSTFQMENGQCTD